MQILKVEREEVNIGFFTLFQALIVFGFITIGGILSTIMESPISIGIGIFALVIFVFAMFIPGLALGVRRLHDTGKSGWWYLLSFVPVGSLVLLIFFCIEGDQHTNKYGSNPKSLNPGDDVTDHLISADDLV